MGPRSFQLWFGSMPSFLVPLLQLEEGLNRLPLILLPWVWSRENKEGISVFVSKTGDFRGCEVLTSWGFCHRYSVDTASFFSEPQAPLLTSLDLNYDRFMHGLSSVGCCNGRMGTHSSSFLTVHFIYYHYFRCTLVIELVMPCFYFGLQKHG